MPDSISTQDLLDQIANGTLDDHLPELLTALQARQTKIRADVLELVQSVFGANAEISIKR